MTGSLVLEERIVQLNSYPERSNANHVIQVVIVLFSMLRQLQDSVMQGFFAIMVLTKDSLLEAIEAMQISVQVATIAHREILRHQ